MNSQDIFKRVLLHWESMPSLEVQPPADPMMIAVLEDRVGRIPASLRSLLLIANGFSEYDGAIDEDGFAFWPVRRIEPVDTHDGGVFSSPHSTPSTTGMLLFADYLDLSWAYAVEVDPAGKSDRVYMVGTADGVPVMVADSLVEFLERYLDDDAALYG